MWRTIGGVLVGYVVMMVLVFAAFSVAYLMMGQDRAFAPGTYDVSALWLLTSLVLGFLAALAGGFVCAAIGKSRKGPLALAGLVVVLGLAMAVPVLMTSDQRESQVRTGEVGNLQAMQQAKQPAWIALANPFVGAAGAVIGARLKKN